MGDWLKSSDNIHNKKTGFPHFSSPPGSANNLPTHTALGNATRCICPEATNLYMPSGFIFWK